MTIGQPKCIYCGEGDGLLTRGPLGDYHDKCFKDVSISVRDVLRPDNEVVKTHYCSECDAPIATGHESDLELIRYLRVENKRLTEDNKIIDRLKETLSKKERLNREAYPNQIKEMVIELDKKDVEIERLKKCQLVTDKDWQEKCAEIERLKNEYKRICDKYDESLKFEKEQDKKLTELIVDNARLSPRVAELDVQVYELQCEIERLKLAHAGERLKLKSENDRLKEELNIKEKSIKQVLWEMDCMQKELDGKEVGINNLRVGRKEYKALVVEAKVAIEKHKMKTKEVFSKHNPIDLTLYTVLDYLSSKLNT